MKVYAVFIYGASELVMYKTTVDADGNLPPLDSYQTVSNYDRILMISIQFILMGMIIQKKEHLDHVSW